MELSSIRTKMDRTELYKHYSQEQIMEYYFGAYIRLKKPYTNPFRDDKTPGCGFFYTSAGALVFHDFKLGAYYDCLQVAGLRLGRTVTPIEVYEQMTNIPKTELPRPQIKFYSEDLEARLTTIKVEIVPFEKTDLDYWNQFNIGIDILKKYNVRKVNKAWINGELRYINTRKDPCYRYTEYDKIKLYRPLNKRYKFRTNYSHPIEGLEHIPETGEILVITKSLKDVMMFASIGIPAVSPRSETSLIHQEDMDKLFARFKNVFLWFDSDVVGVEKSLIMYEKYKNQGLIRLMHDVMLGKDTSDIVKNHGIEKLIDLCKQSEIL